jgi:F-type H+-transporting ATPase subunit alpha
LGTTGKLDKVPVPDVRRFESEFLEFVGRGANTIFDDIRSSKRLDDDTVGSLERAVDAFLDQFRTGEGESLKVNEAEVEAMDASQRGQETVQVKRSR